MKNNIEEKALEYAIFLLTDLLTKLKNQAR